MKKILKWIFVLAALLVSFCCASALAETSGTCGKNLSWMLDDEGTLIISGTGEMTSHPWAVGNVRNTIIEEGVTNICSYAFHNCTNMTSVTISEGVTIIGDHAFYNCGSLTSINFPDSVTSIGDFVFDYCACLESVTIPENVMSIGINTIRNCNNIIWYTALDSNSSKVLSKKGYSFRVQGDNYSLKYLYTDDEITGLEICCVDKDAYVVTIPDNVTSIGNYAFQECRQLYSVTIPASVTIIGKYAFDHCTNLWSLTLPDGITSIDSCTFDACHAIRYAQLESESAKALSEKSYSFRVPGTVCDLIYEFKYESISGISQKTTCGLELVDADKNAVSITIPDGVTSIENNAFSNCSKLTSVYIPNSVRTVEDYAFIGGGAKAKRYVVSMESDSTKAVSKAGYSFRLPDTNYDLKYLYNDTTISGLEIVEVDKETVTFTIPEGVTSINELAFSHHMNLTDVIIPKSMTSIN